MIIQPPPGIDFGVQKGRGSSYETVQTQRSTGTDLTFEIEPTIKSSDDGIDFAGPFVHGPRGGRFVYIDIGASAGQAGTFIRRRMKIPLAGITSEMTGSGRVIEARVGGTGKDGTPACATVKPSFVLGDRAHGG